MGCGASLPSWEVEHTKWWHMLTLDITWTDDTRTRVLGNAEGSVTVKLTITDTASGGSMTLMIAAYVFQRDLAKFAGFGKK